MDEFSDIGNYFKESLVNLEKFISLIHEKGFFRIINPPLTIQSIRLFTPT